MIIYSQQTLASVIASSVDSIISRSINKSRRIFLSNFHLLRGYLLTVSFQPLCLHPSWSSSKKVYSIPPINTHIREKKRLFPKPLSFITATIAKLVVQLLYHLSSSLIIRSYLLGTLFLASFSDPALSLYYIQQPLTALYYTYHST